VLCQDKIIVLLIDVSMSASRRTLNVRGLTLERAELFQASKHGWFNTRMFNVQ